MSCETSEFTTSDSELDLVNLWNNKSNTFEDFHRLESIELNSNKEQPETIIVFADAENSLGNYGITQMGLDISNKTISITDEQGTVYDFNLQVNTMLDDETIDNEIFYDLIPRQNEKNVMCRLACYSLFAIMVASDGPAPIADILAAMALGECLNLCVNQ